MALPDDTSAPGEARRIVREALRRWHLEDLVQDAELAVSELVSNAVRHGLPPVFLAVHQRPGSLRIDVIDTGPPVVPPARRAVSRDGDESGRGQGIVSSVSDSSGVDATGRGKTCFAAWDVPDERR